MIKKLRKALGLSAHAFGEACGLSGRNIARTVYQWESGDQEPNGASRMLIEQLMAKLERRYVIGSSHRFKKEPSAETNRGQRLKGFKLR